VQNLRAHLLLALLVGSLLFAHHANVAADEKEVAKLVVQLKDPNEGVRLKAAKDLGKLKAEAKTAVEALAKVAADDPDEDVRGVAKRSLAAIREAVGEVEKDKDKEVVAPLLKALKSKKAAERVSALEQLTQLGERARSATAAISEAMLDPVESVRDKATVCLEKVDPKLHKLVVAVIYDQNPSDSLVQLGNMGARAKGSIPVLKWRYANPTRNRIWYEALAALVEIVPEDTSVAAEVLKLVSLPPDTGPFSPTVRAREVGLSLLSKVEAPKAKKVGALTAALAEPSVRVDVIGRLAKFGPDAKPALPALMKLKTDSNAAVREAATKAVDAITAE
jgi:HEAT repeat protein